MNHRLMMVDDGLIVVNSGNGSILMVNVGY